MQSMYCALLQSYLRGTISVLLDIQMIRLSWKKHSVGTRAGFLISVEFIFPHWHVPCTVKIPF